ncbi:hypothetical protein FHS42_002629 [Streptomyces zagrosensis]|uniref:Mandelate racemase/muconate lactonizing enzyme C-terminal domain-containing protein n=1 Tax=Streptomyces zagrosensis TaxID=1042984 RepID=A0A7W9UYE3_9ACTN|nr:hypothetical protein [Streptomyces zagrosensis]
MGCTGRQRGDEPSSTQHGPPGACRGAISAVDIALWDLKARLLGLPLVRLLGACHQEVPVYGSGGFTTYDERRQDQQLRTWCQEQGIPRVKIKVGESWGTAEARDLDRVARARRSIGDAAELYVDANGGYDRKQAVRLGPALAAQGVSWFEEPVSSVTAPGWRRSGPRCRWTSRRASTATHSPTSATCSMRAPWTASRRTRPAAAASRCGCGPRRWPKPPGCGSPAAARRMCMPR